MQEDQESTVGRHGYRLQTQDSSDHTLVKCTVKSDLKWLTTQKHLPDALYVSTLRN